MDESQRLSCRLALQHELEVSKEEVSDLLVSAFSSSLKSHRRGTVCHPFPAHLQPHHDYTAAAVVLDALPRLPTVLSNNAGHCSTSDQQLQLLQWLLLQLKFKRGCSMTLVSAEEAACDLQAMGCVLSNLLQNLRSCRCIVRLEKCSEEQPPQPGSCIAAYHGTDFANLHSILHNGLLAASGTRLQTTGAVFGCGVYLSSDFNVAYSFAQGREGWAGSCIGKHLRCVLLCLVDRNAAVEGTGTRAEGHSSLPEKYVLVPKPADVMIRYLLVFSDDVLLGHTAAGVAGARRHGGATLCKYLTAVYIAIMLVLALWQSKQSTW